MVVVLDSPRTEAGVASRWRTTPARMTTQLIVLLAIVLGFGVIGVVGAIQRTSSIASIRTSSGPLAVAAQSLYRSLSDADAAEAGAFLSAGAEPPTLRTRYLADIADATEALTTISASRSDTADLHVIASGLPLYTGLVETARADNRLGLPLGAAYLREASGEMRKDLLPAAERLYAAQSRQLQADSDAGGAFPWFAIPLGLIALIGLIRAQRALTRRTHRVFNVGLAAATVAVAITLGWITISWAADAAHLHSAAVESRRTTVLVEARIDVLKARADESLMLVARNSDRTDFDAATKPLTGRGLFSEAANSGSGGIVTNLNDASADVRAWLNQDAAMRDLNDGGHYPEAVKATMGGGKADAPALFNTVDADIQRALVASNGTLTAQAGQAEDALTGLAIGGGLLIVIAMAGLTIGFQRRIAEYR